MVLNFISTVAIWWPCPWCNPNRSPSQKIMSMGEAMYLVKNPHELNPLGSYDDLGEIDQLQIDILKEVRSNTSIVNQNKANSPSRSPPASPPSLLKLKPIGSQRIILTAHQLKNQKRIDRIRKKERDETFAKMPIPNLSIGS